MRTTQLAVLVLLLTSAAFGQISPQQNLQTCLSGKCPALCNHNLLTSEQVRQARAAEDRENLNTCLTGRYPALCDHSRLTSIQAASVRDTEGRENLSVCLTGQYPALCDHNLLSSDELARVRAAERAVNLKTCMDGRFASICNHALLTPEETKQAKAAEGRAASFQHSLPAVPERRTYARQPRSSTCETGLSIVSVEGDGKVIELDDGSLREVDDADTVDTSLWLPTSDVVICGSKIISVDDNETAEVTPIRRAISPRNTTPPTSSGYEIEVSANDETFVINGEIFKAKRFCFNFDQGNHVKFIEGSPLGACASGKLLDLRTDKVCEVWCE